MNRLRHGVALAAFALVMQAGCASRQEAVDAAQRLADAHYPGRLEMIATNLKTDHYEVTFAVKDDPVTRIRFALDRDPSECRSGSRCEARFTSAYAAGLLAGAKIKAVDQAFGACGVAPIAVYEAQISPGFRTVIELAIDPSDPQPALDRLTACIAGFRQALPADAPETLEALALLIVAPQATPAATPRLTFESRLASSRLDAPTYMVNLAPEADRVTRDMLRLNAHYPGRGLNQSLAEEARRVLRQKGATGHVPQMTFPELTLDPQRLDVVEARVEACSVRTPGEGPCRTDMAVRLRYDLTRGAVLDADIVDGAAVEPAP